MAASLDPSATFLAVPRLLDNTMPVVLTTAGLIAALLVGALVILFVDRWRKRPSEQRFTSGDQLAHFRELYEEGEISREEYDRIRGRLQERLRKEMDVPGTPAAPAAPPTPAPTPDGLRPNGTAPTPPGPADRG